MSRIGVLGCALAALLLAPAGASAGGVVVDWFGPNPSVGSNPVVARCVNAVALRRRLPPVAVSVRGITHVGGNTAVTLYSLGSFGCTVTPDGAIVELIRLYATDFPPYGDAAPYVIQCRFACDW
jgi:hypothetical protein